MNPLLQKTIDLSEQSVKGEYARPYHAILAAGLKAMFSDKTFSYMKDYLKDIKSAEQIPDLVSHGIIKLLSIIWNESKGNMKLEPIGPAAMTLMAHALDYIEHSMNIPITKDVLAQTTMLVNKGVLHFMKVTLKLSDDEFDKLMRGQGKEIVNSRRASEAAPPEPGLVNQPASPPAMQGVM